MWKLKKMIVQNPKTSEDNVVLHYDSSPEEIKENLLCQRKHEKLGINPLL